MAFDASLDKTLESTTVEGKEGTNVEISLRQYGDGDPKIQLSRFALENGEKRYRKLGRLTVEEAGGVWDALGEMLTRLPSSG